MDNTAFSALHATSPIDGRYADKTSALREYFSEWAFMRYRVRVEVEYFIALCGLDIPALKDFPKDRFQDMRGLYLNFSDEDALQIKQTEKVTNHDVKAVEYFIKSKFEAWGLQKYEEFVHFGLTSQDINNTAQPLMLKEGLENVMLPALREIMRLIGQKAFDWAEVGMLARTHGQPASPTVLGKEMLVFVERLYGQLQLLQQTPHSAKFGGATGNLNAHYVALPHIDWVAFANRFVSESLGLNRYQTTTQIEHYDNAAAIFDALARINTILIDFSRDVWTYISMDYFKQRIKAGEVGSSAMPHKVNPIDFENAEGNFGIANALFAHLASKLPVSRLQRDLTDSTVCRNIGVPLAHTLIAFKSLGKGIGKLLLNRPRIDQDLDDNVAVLAEAIQTVLRSIGFDHPYEALKALTRTGSKIDRQAIIDFVQNLNVDPDTKNRLMQLDPKTYTGVYGLEPQRIRERLAQCGIESSTQSAAE
ncbi:MAG: adenylosuccinate lyase [Bacteroides sp.]|nr:adenylosuccinate lyase [Ruminococcus flavefaciens]MCM1555244.1 adenylosuccinate lyase [Bacteroides sp.]